MSGYPDENCRRPPLPFLLDASSSGLLAASARPRFDRYRERVGRLFRDDVEVGLVLVEVEPYAEQVGGHLWWTRLDNSRDVLWLWTLVDGTFSDTLVPDDAADAELRDHDAGRFEHYGESLRVLWTDEEESRRLRSTEFGR